MAAEKILVSDTLDSGFRVKYNNTVDSLINGNATVDEDGVIHFPKVDGSNWSLDIRSIFPTTSDVSALVNPAIRQATDVITGQVRKATIGELIDGSTDFGYVSAAGLKYALENFSLIVPTNLIGDNLFENGLVNLSSVGNDQIGFSVLDGDLIETDYFQLVNGGWQASGNLSIKDGTYATTLENATLTSDRTVTFPDADIVVNDWDSLLNVPTSFEPSYHTHIIGEIVDLSSTLATKQPLNAGLTSITELATNGFVKLTGVNTFAIDTNTYLTTSAATSGYQPIITGTTNYLLRKTSGGVATSGIIYDDGVSTVGMTGLLDINGAIDTWSASIGFADYLSKLEIFTDGETSGTYHPALSSLRKMHFYASDYLFEINGASKKVNFTTTGLRISTDTTASTESLDVVGNIYLSGVIKPTGTAPTTGQFLKASSSSAMIWADLGMSVSGTTSYIPKFTNSTTLGNSNITDDGTTINIGDIAYIDDTAADGRRIKLNYPVAIAGSVFYDNSDAVVGNKLALDTNELYIDGNIELAGAFSIGQEYLKLYKSNDADGNPQAYISNAYSNIYITSTKTNIVGSLGVSVIEGILGANVTANQLWNFSTIPQVTTDATTGNQLVRLSQVQTLLSGGFAISTSCKLVFIDNQSLSGSKTQGGYTTVTNDYILLTGQTTASANGIYKFDGTNFARPTDFDSDGEIRGKGHLITQGTYANTQWVNSNSSAITVGSTTITYNQWGGAETDPVWTAFQTLYSIDATRIGNWNTSYSWGNHGSAGYYLAANFTTDATNNFNTRIALTTTASLTEGSNLYYTQARFDSAFATKISNEVNFSNNISSVGGFFYGAVAGSINATGLLIGANVSGTTANILAYNPATATKKPLSIDGSTVALKINGSIGASGTFLKSTGSVLVYGGVVVADISDISSTYLTIATAASTYLTQTDASTTYAAKTDTIELAWYEGERGFLLYSDVEKQKKEAIFFTNPDTGVVGIHSYGLSGTTITESGLQIDKDGYLYHKKLNGNRSRILTTDDSLEGGGAISYSYTNPIVISSNNNISVKYASPVQDGVISADEYILFSEKQDALISATASQRGILEAADFTIFQNKFGEGSTVTTFLDFAEDAVMYFGRLGIGDQSIGKIELRNYNGGADPDLVVESFGSNSDIVLLSTASIIARSSNISNPLVDGVEVDLGANLPNSILKFNGSNMNFRKSSPTDGQKYVFQYSASTNKFTLVNA